MEIIYKQKASFYKACLTNPMVFVEFLNYGQLTALSGFMSIKICYLLLCHKDPESVIEQVRYLVDKGGYVVVHMDKRAPHSYFRLLETHLADYASVRFAKPVKAGWGDWSLVSATLRMMRIGLDEFPDATNFYYLSGDCVPIRSYEDLVNSLSSQKYDYIETVDFYKSGWVQTGPHLERIQFYHFINERKYKKLFYLSYKIQRWLGVDREPPDGIIMSIGSQWWCLRRRTIERILLFVRARPDVARFFKRSWIPDEIFFQSLVATLVPKSGRINKPPTFFRFSDYGLPAVFYDDHFNFLTKQEEFFARKISPEAVTLKRRLLRQFVEPSKGVETVNTGRATVGFNAYAGREGVRFGPSFWERGGRMPNECTIYAVVAKKWHIGQTICDELSSTLDILNLGYLFDGDYIPLGDLGGFEKNREKRLQSPATFIRMICEIYNIKEVIIGLDPARYKVLKALAEATSSLRILEIESEFSEEYLDGHAHRSGLMLEQSRILESAALHQTFIEIFRRESIKISEIECEKLCKLKDKEKKTKRNLVLSEFLDRPSKVFGQTSFDFEAEI